jgi:hypothetical protein
MPESPSPRLVLSQRAVGSNYFGGNVYLFCAEVRAASAGATIGFSGMLPGTEPDNANMHETSLQPAQLRARQVGNTVTWRARCFLRSRSCTRGGSVRGLEEIDKRFADIRDPTDFCVDFDHLSVVPARDLDCGLVALHLANAIKRLDFVADLDKPLNNLHLCPVGFTCRGADTHTDRRARTHNRDTLLSAQTWAAARPVRIAWGTAAGSSPVMPSPMSARLNGMTWSRSAARGALIARDPSRHAHAARPTNSKGFALLQGMRRASPPAGAAAARAPPGEANDETCSTLRPATVVRSAGRAAARVACPIIAIPQLRKVERVQNRSKKASV